MSQKEIIIYEAEDGQTKLEVNLQEDTLWLSQKQMAELFDKNVRTINEHIKSIIKSGELNENSVIRNFRITASDGKEYNTKCYNLDMIISVGYRVNSKRGTQFRIWATNVLRQHIIEGYTLNEHALKQKIKKLGELEKMINVLTRTINNKELTNEESTGLLKVISDYSYALNLLDDYDHQKLKIHDVTIEQKFIITYDDAIKQIKRLRDRQTSELFGKEKDDSFKSSMGAIYQTFDGKDLYPSVEEKAANLLYLVVKNHSFTDGNKRIGASVFLWFLDGNEVLYSENGSKIIEDNTLVAITLLIAESKPKDKDIIIKVIVNLINKKNSSDKYIN